MHPDAASVGSLPPKRSLPTNLTRPTAPLAARGKKTAKSLYFPPVEIIVVSAENRGESRVFATLFCSRALSRTPPHDKVVYMIFSINKSLFSDALSLVASVVPERSARPILQNLLLAGNADGSIRLSATDLEIGISMTVQTEKMTDPATVLLPAGRLNALIKGTFAEDLQISIENNRAEIKTKQGKFQIPGQDPTEYPVIPEFVAEKAIFIHGDDFAEAIQKTVFATAKGDTRYALNGIYLNIDEHGAQFVASDTHRLALVKKKIRNPDKMTAEGIILTKGMNILARMAAGVDAVEINMTANEMLARTANATLVIRRVEGMFPRYADVIPPKSESFFTVNRESLLRALHSIGLMAPDESKSAIFAVTPGALRVSASSDHGEGDMHLDAETNGSDIEIKFNYVFLVDALKTMADDTVTIQYKDADSPARLDSGDFMYIIMPINR